jgi:DNA-binding CsgD family transcriptional regulator
MQGIDLSSHYFMKVGNDLNQVMAPVLSEHGINFFRYFKLNADGSRVHLCNNSDWTNHFYKEGLYKVAWYDRYEPSYHASNRSIWDEKVLTSDNIVGIHARTIFDIHHGFSVIKAHDNYCEVFDFATTQDNTEINNLYKRSPESLDDIIFFFRNKARSLILDANKNIISLPMEMKLRKSELDTKVLNHANISKYFIDTDNGETYLTRREYDCVSLWFCGKTAKQIGAILGMSFRTVETHLENVKGKFNIGSPGISGQKFNLC